MFKRIIFICLTAAALSGCSLPVVKNSGVTPAVIATDVKYPSEFNGSARFNIETKAKFNILGIVTAKGESTNILGIIAQGDNGYSNLIDTAKKMGADDVINITTDIKYHYYFFGAFQKVVTNLTGTAIKYEVDGKPLNFYPQTPQFYNQPANYYPQFQNQFMQQQYMQPQSTQSTIQQSNIPQHFLQSQMPQMQTVQQNIDIPDKNRNYFLMIGGQQYGPISVKQIEEMKKMGYCNNETLMIDSVTNKFYKVGDLAN